MLLFCIFWCTLDQDWLSILTKNGISKKDLFDFKSTVPKVQNQKYSTKKYLIALFLSKIEWSNMTSASITRIVMVDQIRELLGLGNVRK